MNPLRALVVDDEPLARTRLQRLLGELPSDVQVVGALESAEGLAEACSRLKVDLLFLDIRMRGPGVFEAIQRMPARRPQIVFVTAYEAYAVNAFKVEATDYLVKPISYETVAKAVRRARTLALRQTLASMLDQRIPVSTGHRTRMLALGSITHLLAQGNYVEIHTEREAILTRMTMDNAGELLPEPLFLRVHRSWIVRTDQVLELHPAGSGRYRIMLASGLQVTSGRTYNARIRARLPALAGAQNQRSDDAAP